MIKNSIAVADLGSNSFHFALFKFDETDSPIFLEKERIAFRLSDFQSKIISSEKFEEGLSIIEKFKNLAETKEAPLVITGTSALRESSNGGEFIDEVEKKFHLKINLLSGEDESRLIYYGVRTALPNMNEITCFDIGGGSAEIINGAGAIVNYSESFKLGAVRLSGSFFPNFMLTKQNVSECREYVRKILRGSNQLKKIKTEEILVGTAGTAVNLLYVIQQNGSPHRKFSEPVEIELAKEMIELVLQNKTPEQRRDIKGMDEKRAEIIPAGLIILDEIMNLLSPKYLIVTQQGLREGVAQHFYKQMNLAK